MYLNPVLNKQSLVLHTCFECSSTLRCWGSVWHTEQSSKNWPETKPYGSKCLCCLWIPCDTCYIFKIALAHTPKREHGRLTAHTFCTLTCMEGARRPSNQKDKQKHANEFVWRVFLYTCGIQIKEKSNKKAQLMVFCLREQKRQKQNIRTNYLKWVKIWLGGLGSLSVSSLSTGDSTHSISQLCPTASCLLRVLVRQRGEDIQQCLLLKWGARRGLQLKSVWQVRLPVIPCFVWRGVRTCARTCTM